MPNRTTVLPDRGVAIVSTDVHGNLEDIRAVRRVFEASGPEAHGVVSGDLVHGPEDEARAENPPIYGYPDESMRVVEEVVSAQAGALGRVHFVFGNHDHGPVGGPHTRKFHRDEVAHLEASLSPAEKHTLTEFFSSARVAPYLARGLGGFLTHYGQRDAVCARFPRRCIVRRSVRARRCARTRSRQAQFLPRRIAATLPLHLRRTPLREALFAARSRRALPPCEGPPGRD